MNNNYGESEETKVDASDLNGGKNLMSFSFDLLKIPFIKKWFCKLTEGNNDKKNKS